MQADLLQQCEWFDIAVIVGAHGIKGEMVAINLSTVEGRLEKTKEAFLCDPKHVSCEPVQVKTRPHQGKWLIQVSGVTDRTLAEQKKGWYIAITRQQALPLPQGAYFVRDLIGFSVVDQHDRKIGELKDVHTDRVQDLYQVARSGQPDLYFPDAGDILQEIDIHKRQIRVDLPVGLEEIYTSSR